MPREIFGEVARPTVQLGSRSKYTVLVSIAAGVPLAAVQRHSGHRASVRVMPNLPAAIGQGAAVYFAAEEVTAQQRGHVRAVLDAVATAVIEAHDDDAGVHGIRQPVCAQDTDCR